jgi:hypothetical protein
MLEDPKVLSMFKENSKGQDTELALLKDTIKEAEKRARAAIVKVMEASSKPSEEKPQKKAKTPRKKPVRETAKLSRYSQKRGVPKEFAAVFEMAE